MVSAEKQPRVYSYDDPERLQFARENVAALLRDKELRIERQRERLAQLEKALAEAERDVRWKQRAKLLASLLAPLLYAKWSEENYAASWMMIPDYAFARKAMAEQWREETSELRESEEEAWVERALWSVIGDAEAEPEPAP